MVRGAVEATELVHQQKADGHCRRIVEMLQRSKNFGATLPEATQMSRWSGKPWGFDRTARGRDTHGTGRAQRAGGGAGERRERHTRKATSARQPGSEARGREQRCASRGRTTHGTGQARGAGRRRRRRACTATRARQISSDVAAARRKRQRNANRAAARAPGTHQGEVAAPQRGRKQGRAIAQGQRHVLASKAAVRLTCHAVAVSRSVGGHRARKATD